MKKYTSATSKREVAEHNQNGTIILFFNYLYDGQSQTAQSKSYSVKSRKLANRKIQEWLTA